jgi:hypothetical protein
LESGKKRVITYLSNLGLLKMDGANLTYEALDAKRSRLAGLCLRRLCVSAGGGAFRADLGSSSIFINILRRVHPLYRRRLCESTTKGTDVNIHLVPS